MRAKPPTLRRLVRGRNGAHRQRSRREAERGVRRSAVALMKYSALHGVGRSQCASQLGVSPATLRRWKQRWRDDRMKLRPRGRPVRRSGRQTRQAILSVFTLVGPSVGVPTLEEFFPGVARSELVEMQHRYRRALRTRRRLTVHALRWTRPGAVWAEDFAEAPCAIDGLYEHVHAVRDLGSSATLQALPVEAQDAEGACSSVEALFRWHGAPLVIKHDNGSAFASKQMRDLASRWGVLLLYSPPGIPSYNGAIEAGIGGLKTRAHHHSARNDRPGQWSCDDVEAARLEGNATARPRGPVEATPQLLWDRRRRIIAEERAAFRLSYEIHLARQRRDRGVLPGIEPAPRVRDSIGRVAITRALIERGYLLVRRRRISLPITRSLKSKIS